MNLMFMNRVLQLLLFSQLEDSLQPAAHRETFCLLFYQTQRLPIFLRYSSSFFSLWWWPDRKIRCWVLAMPRKMSSACTQIPQEREITRNNLWISVYHISPCLHPIVSVSVGRRWRREIVDTWNLACAQHVTELLDVGNVILTSSGVSCWHACLIKVGLSSSNIRIMRVNLILKQLLIFSRDSFSNNRERPCKHRFFTWQNS